MNASPTWYDSAPLRRLGIVFGVGFLAILSSALAWALSFSYSAGSWIFPRVYETWALQLASYGASVLGVTSSAGLAALVRPHRLRGWLGCVLGGALVAFALDQAWIVQLSMWRSGGSIMDYRAALADLKSYHHAMGTFQEPSMVLLMVLGLCPSWALLLWSWLAQRERWQEWVWLLFTLPLLASVAQTFLVFADAGPQAPELTLGHFLVFPNLAFGAALVLALCWIQTSPRVAAWSLRGSDSPDQSPQALPPRR